MCQKCKCECSCHEKIIPFSEMTKEQQRDLRKKARSGLERKFLDAEDLKHRNKLEQAIEMDEKRHRDAHRLFLDLKHR